MPFIEPELRQFLLNGEIQPQEVGELCFLAYCDMVKKWKEAPRWTTAHTIYKDLLKITTGIGYSDEYVARHLAWQVFFQKYVMDYENKKEKENGSI